MTKQLKKLPKAFQDWLKNRKIEEVECIISDLSGVSRGKASLGLNSRGQIKFSYPSPYFIKLFSRLCDMDIKGNGLRAIWYFCRTIRLPFAVPDRGCYITSDLTMFLILMANLMNSYQEIF